MCVHLPPWPAPGNGARRRSRPVRPLPGRQRRGVLDGHGDGHARLGFPNEAAALFLAKEEEDDPGVALDAVAAVAEFAAFAEAGDLTLAREAHQHIAAREEEDLVPWPSGDDGEDPFQVQEMSYSWSPCPLPRFQPVNAVPSLR